MAVYKFSPVYEFSIGPKTYVSRDRWNAGRLSHVDAARKIPTGCSHENDSEHPKNFVNSNIAAACVWNRWTSDFMWYPGLIVCLDEIANALTEAKFTGFEIHPINLFADRKCKVPLEGYKEIKVTGRVEIDIERSGIRSRYKCPECGKGKFTLWDNEKGLHFLGDETGYPDIFKDSIHLTDIHFVTDRVAEFLKNSGWKNFMLTPLDEVKAVN